MSFLSRPSQECSHESRVAWFVSPLVLESISKDRNPGRPSLAPSSRRFPCRVPFCRCCCQQPPFSMSPHPRCVCTHRLPAPIDSSLGLGWSWRMLEGLKHRSMRPGTAGLCWVASVCLRAKVCAAKDAPRDRCFAPGAVPTVLSVTSAPCAQASPGTVFNAPSVRGALCDAPEAQALRWTLFQSGRCA